MLRKKDLLLILSILAFCIGGSGCSAKTEEGIVEATIPVISDVAELRPENLASSTSEIDLQGEGQVARRPGAASRPLAEWSDSNVEESLTDKPRTMDHEEETEQERIFPTKEIPSDSQALEEPLMEVLPTSPAQENHEGGFDGFDCYVDYESCERDILAYLNSGRSPDTLQTSLQEIEIPEWVKEDPFTQKMDKVAVLNVDITGDGVNEVLVILKWEPNYSNVDLDRVLLVFTPDGDAYRLLDRIHALDLVWRPYDLEVDRVQDMNLDGRNEIILTVPDFQGPGGINLLYVTFILRWNGSELEHLLIVPEEAFLQPYANGAGALNNRPGIADYDGDGSLDLIVKHRGLFPGGSSRNRFAETGPMRGRTEIWSWDGKRYSLTTQLDPAVYYIHVVYDADDASLAGEYERAMSLYLQLIFDDKLRGWGTNFEKTEVYEPPEERQRLSAYATYRIMLLHVLWGNEAEAQRDLETLHEYFPVDNPHYPFTEMASVFMDTYQTTRELGTACVETSKFATSAVYSGRDTYWHEFNLLSMLGVSYYGWYNRDYSPVDICPFQ
jgi:hypothetical protein